MESEARKKFLASQEQQPVKQKEETKNIETKEGQRKNQENNEMQINSESINVDTREERSMALNAENGSCTDVRTENYCGTNINTEERRVAKNTGKDKDMPMNTENERCSLGK